MGGDGRFFLRYLCTKCTVCSCSQNLYAHFDWTSISMVGLAFELRRTGFIKWGHNKMLHLDTWQRETYTPILNKCCTPTLTDSGWFIPIMEGYIGQCMASIHNILYNKHRVYPTSV